MDAPTSFWINPQYQEEGEKRPRYQIECIIGQKSKRMSKED